MSCWVLHDLDAPRLHLVKLIIPPYLHLLRPRRTRHLIGNMD